MIKPPVAKNRQSSFNYIIDKLQPNSNIIEIGSTRMKGNWEGDGYSTILFGWLISRLGGQLTSVDIDPQNAIVCQEILNEYEIPMLNISLLTTDGLEFAKTYKTHIDLLYLDAWDYFDDNRYNSAENHLLCFKQFMDNGCIDNTTLVLIDDIHDNLSFIGKGYLLIPYMIDIGFTFIVNEYQVLMKLM